MFHTEHDENTKTKQNIPHHWNKTYTNKQTLSIDDDADDDEAEAGEEWIKTKENNEIKYVHIFN